MHVLESAKETDNKLRWDAFIDDVKFSLYIPKWRVPEPWPSTIYVVISEQLTNIKSYKPMNPQIAQTDPALLKSSIMAVLNWESDHTKTVRFSPVGNSKEWEIGEPYIPYALLPQNSKRSLLIEIKWKP